MKNLRLRVVLFAALLAAGAFGTTGCSKIKGLFSKKSTAPPAESETADRQAPVPAGSLGGDRTVAVATPAPTPARPTGPSVNKNAAVMVLCYHRLEEKPRPGDPLAMTPVEFKKEMQQIKDAGFTVIPLQDMLAWKRGDKDIPAKSAVITIDDGYVSGYDTAWPILKEFGYPFTMFVYINYINTGGKSISWGQLGEMRDAGVDIESHTYSHADLRNPNNHAAVDKHNFDLIQKDVATLGHDGWLRKEIMDSKKVLEDHLGIKVNALAYPIGGNNAQVREMVKDAGYEAAFSVYGRRVTNNAPPFEIGRYAVEQSKPEIFRDALTMVGGGLGDASAAPSDLAEFAATSMVTQPADGETVTSKPTIKANLATMGNIDPNSVEMHIGGIGQVKAKYDAATKTLTYPITETLREKTSYTVIVNAKIGGKRAETRWSFTFDPKGTPGVKPPPKP